MVRSVPGDRAAKAYVCPGCHVTIGIGVPHVVTWPSDPGWAGGSGVEQRRHWHSGCWARRL